MWRVSSGVSARDPTGARRPLTSTIGGLPGEKNRSLILGALRSMAVNRAGVESGAGAGAGDGAAPAAAWFTLLGEFGVLFGGVLLETDMDPRTRRGSDCLKPVWGPSLKRRHPDYLCHHDLVKMGQPPSTLSAAGMNLLRGPRNLSATVATKREVSR